MIIKFKDLSKIRKRLKNSKIVFAGGSFDILHIGHMKYFEKIKKMGDILVIAVSSDKRIRERKGPERPILDQNNRLSLVNAIKFVDYALIAPNPTKNNKFPTQNIISELKPDIFVSIDTRWLPFRRKIESNGTKLKIVKETKINSTSRIIKKILRRYKSKSWT